jgi:putative membrane protein
MEHAHHAAFESLWGSALLILVAVCYLRGWVRLRRINPETIEEWRVGGFLLGLFLIWLVMASPIAALDHQLLIVHMVHHLLLMTIAAPLVWLGAPVKALEHGLPQRLVLGLIAPLLRWPPMKRLGLALANPTVCWLAAATTLVGWHIPSVFIVGMRSATWHEIEQASFLAAGLLFWWPVIRPWPSVSNGSEWPILLYLFLATLPCDILSGFLVFCDRVVYPAYFSSTRGTGFSALEDQQCAGALMWTCVTVVYLIAGTVFAARLLSPESSQQYTAVKSDSILSTVPQTIQQSMEVV